MKEVTCSSCQEQRNLDEIYLLEPTVGLCYECLEDGNFRSHFFFDLVYVIQLRLRQTADLLKSRMVREENGRAGWYHYLDAQRIGISSTAYAIDLLRRLEPDYPALPETSETVLTAFLRDDSGSEPSRGGWPMASIPGVVLVEPTCYCLFRLLRSGFLLPDSALIGMAREWLLTQQKGDGSWGPCREVKSSTYVTCLATETLATLRHHSPLRSSYLDAAIGLGLSWIADAQKSDKGWGRAAGEIESNPWDTAHALSALLVTSSERKAQLVEEAVDWLLHNASDWSETLTYTYELSSPSGAGRATYVFHPKPIAVETLLRAGVSPYHPIILRSVFEIIAAQDAETGIWRYPGDERGTIFELHHNASCLIEFLERSSSVGSVLSLNDQLQKTIHQTAALEGQVSSLNRSIVTQREFLAREVFSAHRRLWWVSSVIAAGLFFLLLGELTARWLSLLDRVLLAIVTFSLLVSVGGPMRKASAIRGGARALIIALALSLAVLIVLSTSIIEILAVLITLLAALAQTLYSEISSRRSHSGDSESVHPSVTDEV